MEISKIKRGMKRLIVGLISAAMIIGAVPMSAIAASQDFNPTQQKIVRDEQGRFYVTEADVGKMYVYCFDRDCLWPEVGLTYNPETNTQLTDNQKKARELIRRVLYAAWPNNGAGIYDEEWNVIGAENVKYSADEYNAAMNSWDEEFAQIVNKYNNSHKIQDGMDFSMKEDGTFKNPEAKAVVVEFLRDHLYSIPDTADYNTIIAKPCFSAWQFSYEWEGYFSLEELAEYYTYILTVSPTDDAQSAIWRIEKEYELGYNTHGYAKTPGEEALYEFAKSDTPIPPENAVIEESIKLYDDSKNKEITNGDIVFTRNVSDGKYYSQELIIKAQTNEDKPLYKTEYAVTYNDSANSVQTVTSDESFRLVCDSKPSQNGTVKISGSFKWPSKIYVYETTAYSEVHHKNYQRMGGVYLKEQNLTTQNLSYSIAPTGSLSIKKLVDGKDAPSGNSYLFTVDLTNTPEKYFSNGARIPATIDGKNTVVKCVSTGNTTARLYDIELKAGETITINELPAGINYTVNEAVPTPVENWTYSYANRTGAIVADATQSAVVTNTYSKNYDGDSSTSLEVNGKKLVAKLNENNSTDYTNPQNVYEAGKMPAFDFVMWPLDEHSPMPAGTSTSYNNGIKVSNDGNGNIAFGTITFNKEGTYSYYIEELNDKHVQDVSNDIHHWEMKIVVKDGNNDGKLDTPDVTYERHHPGNDGNCNIEEYKNKVSAPLTFVNTESTTQMSERIVIEKKITGQHDGINLSRAGYEFSITPDTSDEKLYPEVNGSRSWKVATSKSGEAVSPELTFDTSWYDKNSEKADEKGEIKLKYNVKEVIPSQKVPGISYTDITQSAVIHIKKITHTDGDKTNVDYDAWVTYEHKNSGRAENMPLLFENSYSPSSTTARIYVDKSFSNENYRPSKDESYSFSVDAITDGAPKISDVVLTANASGEFTRSGGESASFTRTGEYRYRITENDLSDEGYVSKSDAEWEATVTIGDNGLGALEVASVHYVQIKADSGTTIPENERTIQFSAAFNNPVSSDYHNASATLNVKKIITGREWADNDSFTFSVRGVRDKSNDLWDSDINPLVESQDSEPADLGINSFVIDSKATDHSNDIELKFQKTGVYYVIINEADSENKDLNLDSRTFVSEIFVFDTGEGLAAWALPAYVLKQDADWSTREYAGNVVFQNDVKTKIYGNTLTIGNQIKVNYYIEGLTAETVKDYYMTFSRRGEKPVVANWENLTRNGGASGTLYGFTYSNVYAYQMGDPIEAKLYYKNGNIVDAVRNDYSIKKYADNMLAKSSTSTSLKNMLVDMLNYGAAAQGYAHKENWADISEVVINEKLTPEQKNAVDEVSVPDTENTVISDSGNESVKVESVSLAFNSNMNLAMRMKFRFIEQAPKDYKLGVFSDINDGLTINGVGKNDKNIILIDTSAYSFDPNKLYSIGLERIPPFFWDYKYKLIFMDKDSEDEVYSIGYSINSYIYRMLNNKDMEDPELAKLLKSMYKYQSTAKAWFKS